MKVHSVEQAVRYVETDRMKIVHHSTYLSWFEIGRTSLLAEVGFPYHELELSGTMFPVIEYACKLIGSADYGDKVRIDTHIETLRSRAVIFGYHVYNEDKLIATGSTKHVAVNLDYKPHRMPDALVDALRDYAQIRTEARSL